MWLHQSQVELSFEIHLAGTGIRVFGVVCWGKRADVTVASYDLTD